MPVYKYIHFLFAMLAAHTAAAAEQNPVFFNAVYALFSNGLEIARMERSMRPHGDNEYLYSSITDTVGLVTLIHKDHIAEESHWKLDGTRVVPLLYSYVRSGGRKERRITINFDWDKNEIINRVNDRNRHMELRIGILDKLLYQYALMCDLRNHQSELVYDVTDGGKMKKYHFAQLGEEVVHTPMGDLKTLKLHKIKQDDASKLIIWSAPEFNFLPVKIEATEEDGRTTTGVIQSLVWL